MFPSFHLLRSRSIWRGVPFTYHTGARLVGAVLRGVVLLPERSRAGLELYSCIRAQWARIRPGTAEWNYGNVVFRAWEAEIAC